MQGAASLRERVDGLLSRVSVVLSVAVGVNAHAARRAGRKFATAVRRSIAHRLDPEPEPFAELDALRRGLIPPPPPSFFERLFATRQFIVRGAGSTVAVSLSSRLQMRLAAVLVVGTLGVGYILVETIGDRMRLFQLTNEVAGLRESARIEGARAEADRARLEILDREHEDAVQLASDEGRTLADQKNDIERLAAERDQAATQRDKALAERDAAWTASLEVLLHLDAKTHTTIAEVERIISSTGLNPSRMIKVPVSEDRNAPRGGPFVPWQGQPTAAAATAGSIDLRSADDVAQGLSRLQALRDILAHVPLASPVGQVEILNGYGYRVDPFSGFGALHEGLDLRSRNGNVIYATAAGTVSFAGWKGDYGNTVDIDHGFGLVTRYAHLSRIDVRAGDIVALHRPLGLIGATGRATAVHLHYEVRVDGRARNPVNFLKADRYLPEADRHVPETDFHFPEEILRTSAAGTVDLDRR